MTNKVLISWLAFNNDFEAVKGKTNVDKSGPTFAFHQYFYKNYDHHILLSSKSKEDVRLSWLVNALKHDFRDHVIVPDVIPITDVINVKEIKTKIESYLIKLKATEIDIFVSPGTPQMQIAWYMAHTGLGLKTNLLQTRAKKHTGSDRPELITINIEKSSIPVTAMMNQINEEDSTKRENYKITESIKPIYFQAKQVAQTDAVTVLILGETGTGKEHLAYYVHKESVRKNNSFITVNCSAIGDSLLESRLFGYKKGAFTGADEDRSGLFKKADGGTLFLDEIGDISPQMQQSLLRVLQEKEITPVGGVPQNVDVRIVAATHKDLPQMCKEGRFRWDLYYRLAVVELELKPLRERSSAELKGMIDFFLKKEKKELRKPVLLKLSKEAKDILLKYEFPGNLRELENLIRRLYVFVDYVVDAVHLPSRLTEKHRESSLDWKDVERGHIIKVLRLKKDNMNQTYLALGYGSVNRLKRKMEEYGIASSQQ